ncbi:hypothetical protein AB0M34_30765 [Nocardia sp. NPDC050193]
MCPLTTRTTESEELLALADAKGVRHIVGLQRRLGPAARYAGDLLAQGYVGEVRAARLSVGVGAFAPVMPGAVAWTFDVANFTHVLSGHFLDRGNSSNHPSRIGAIGARGGCGEASWFGA